MSSARVVAALAARATILAPLTSGVVAARMVQIGHGFGDRAWTVLGLFAVAAFGAALVVFAAGAIAARWIGPRLRVALVAIALPFAILGAGAFCYAIFDRIIMGNIDDFDSERGFLHAIVLPLGSAVYLFATSGLRYLLPWPAVILGLAGAALEWRAARRG